MADKLSISRSESAQRTLRAADAPSLKSRWITPRIIFLCLSFVAIILCACAAAAHYRQSNWGDLWQPIGWLLSMLFLLFAFLPHLRELATGLKTLTTPKAGFFLFWIVFFVVSHLWNFRTAPWNGDGIFADAAQDLLFLKTHVTSRPFQAAWFETYGAYGAHETLFHYYLWQWLHLFGYNILTNEAALLGLWCTTFLFTLLLIDLFFQSYVVTSVIALVFTFLPFAFIYTFVGYHYEISVPLCIASVYFLHVGFKTDSSFCLAMGGIAAGLCLAGSVLGKQVHLSAFGGCCALRSFRLETPKAGSQLALGPYSYLRLRCRSHAYFGLYCF